MNVKSTSQTSAGFSRGISLASLPNRLLRHLCERMFFSCHFPCSVSSLGHHVVSVVLRRPKKQVGWVTAKRGVAGMTDENAGGNESPAGEHPTYAVGSVIPAISAKDSISIRIFAGLPQPAFIRRSDIYLRPKSGLVVFVENIQRLMSFGRIHSAIQVRAAGTDSSGFGRLLFWINNPMASIPI